jgi:uncharacterized protein YjbI with pentapeptide repeats
MAMSETISARLFGSRTVMYTVLVLLLAILAAATARAQEEECSCEKRQKWYPEPDELKRILTRHEDWLAGGSPDAARDRDRAALCNAELDGADLSKRNLSLADLECANLNRADLSYTKLRNASLRRASLKGANLIWTDLSDAKMVLANLSGAQAKYATFSKADLLQADLTKATLEGAILAKAKLPDAKAESTDLRESDLSEAELDGTDIKDAMLSGATLKGTKYQPRQDPHRDFLDNLHDLETVTFDQDRQTSLVRLRDMLHDTGLRRLERDVTLALERGLAEQAGAAEFGLKTLLFDWTAEYGRDYTRPLTIALLLIPAFALVYLIPIAVRSRAGGIYRVYPRECLVVQRDRADLTREARVERVEARNLSSLWLALVFSLHSAFYVGFREVSAGSWITRLFPVEQVFRPLGWVRFASGVQALVTFYLITLAVLSYIGRPFAS